MAERLPSSKRNYDQPSSILVPSSVGSSNRGENSKKKYHNRFHRKSNNKNWRSNNNSNYRYMKNQKYKYGNSVEQYPSVENKLISEDRNCNNNQNCFDGLPDNILTLIFSFLDLHSLKIFTSLYTTIHP